MKMRFFLSACSAVRTSFSWELGRSGARGDRRMGLDAAVYCDCFERGRLQSPPPPGCTLAVAPDGSLLCGSDDLDVQLAFDRWRQSEACEHEDGYLVSHWIGNIALVASLRAE